MQAINITEEFKKSLKTQENPPVEGTPEFGIQRQEFVNQKISSSEWVDLNGPFYDRKKWENS